HDIALYRLFKAGQAGADAGQVDRAGRVRLRVKIQADAQLRQVRGETQDLPLALNIGEGRKGKARQAEQGAADPECQRPAAGTRTMRPRWGRPSVLPVGSSRGDIGRSRLGAVLA